MCALPTLLEGVRQTLKAGFGGATDISRGAVIHFRQNPQTQTSGGQGRGGQERKRLRGTQPFPCICLWEASVLNSEPTAGLSTTPPRPPPSLL